MYIHIFTRAYIYTRIGHNRVRLRARKGAQPRRTQALILKSPIYIIYNIGIHIRIYYVTSSYILCSAKEDTGTNSEKSFVHKF